MASRLELQALLESITDHVYFQPPATVFMEYPSIIYRRDDSRVDYADNRLYTRMKRYQVTVLDRDPDSELPDQVEQMRYTSFDRFFVADNLNHWVFTLFF